MRRNFPGTRLQALPTHSFNLISARFGLLPSIDDFHYKQSSYVGPVAVGYESRVHKKFVGQVPDNYYGLVPSSTKNDI